MADRPWNVALILPPVPAYSRAVTEGVIERRRARRPWRLVDLPHLRPGHSPLPLSGLELDGVIVWADWRDQWVRTLLSSGVKVINCGSDWLGVPGVVNVRARMVDAGAAVVRHFEQLGLKNILMVGHALRKRASMARILEDFSRLGMRAGMMTGIQDIGGRLDPGDFPRRLFETEKEARLVSCLRAMSAPTGVFCENDHVGVIVCRVAAMLGLNIPGDLAVVGYGDNLVAQFSEPPLTSIAPPGREIGRVAASALAAWMDTGVVPVADQVIGGMQLVARESSVGPAGRAELERVRRHIAHHALEGLTVNDLVGLFGFSVKTLVRHYRQAFGVEPADEIRDIRMGEARRLLRESDAPVAAVAKRCGFSSQAGFYNYFVRHEGVSPTDFRAAADPGERD